MGAASPRPGGGRGGAARRQTKPRTSVVRVEKEDGSSGKDTLKLASKDANPDEVKLKTANDPPPSNDDDDDDDDDEKLPSVPPTDQIKVGWTEHIDPATNYPYWTNDETGESTWHKPPSPPPPPPPRASKPWKAVWDETSRKYHFRNMETGEISQSGVPADMPPPRRATSVGMANALAMGGGAARRQIKPRTSAVRVEREDDL